jgi:LacI family transcriptional regulator
MKDIAQAAGVSVTTVSHVLNNSRPVSEDAAVRVRDAVRDLGYRPNRLARSLRRSESLTIGFVVPDLSNPFFAEIGRGLEDAGFRAGYNAIFCSSAGDPERERRAVSALVEKRVAGIVIAPAESRPDRLASLLAGDVPVVIVDRDLPVPDCDFVLANNRAGGQQAVELLVSLGHRRIGCIVAGAASRPATPGRLSGYQQGIQDAGLDNTGLLVAVDDLPGDPPASELDAGYRATRQLLESRNPPTALFMTNDLMAIGALRAATDRGLSVPGDLSIVGFDDILLARYASPSLTSVSQPREAMGRIAAELAIERSSNRQRTPERRNLDVTLVTRESTGPCPA